MELVIPFVRLALPWVRKKLQGNDKVRRVLGKVAGFVEAAESLTGGNVDGAARLRWVLEQLTDDADFGGLKPKQQRQLVNQVHAVLDGQGLLQPTAEVREAAERAARDSLRCLVYATEIVDRQGHSELARDLREVFGIEARERTHLTPVETTP